MMETSNLEDFPIPKKLIRIKTATSKSPNPKSLMRIRKGHALMKPSFGLDMTTKPESFIKS